MDLENYSNEEIILSALKSEIEANRLYLEIAGKLKNAFLKDKLKFIADEEDRHRQFLEQMYRSEFPEKSIELPGKTPVPLPEIDIKDETIKLSSIFEMAMTAELAANEFYNSFAERYSNSENIVKTLRYFATMELGHYRLFELEKENMERFEDFDSESPMMHVGP